MAHSIKEKTGLCVICKKNTVGKIACPNCGKNSIPKSTGICELCGVDFTEEIQANENEVSENVPLTHLQKEPDMAARKVGAASSSKATKLPKETKSTKAGATKAPKAPKEPKEVKETIGGTIVALLLEQMYTSGEIHEALKEKYGDIGQSIGVSRIACTRWAINHGKFPRAVQAANITLPLKEVKPPAPAKE
jgi:ribosomal protein L37E